MCFNMIILWLFVAIVLLLAAYHMIPKKSHKNEIHSPPDIVLQPKSLVEEKDTKRYWEDMRSLYPL